LCNRKEKAVLRTHRYRRDKEEDKYFYSKLLLYLPWRDADKDLCRNTYNSYKELYTVHIKLIQANESQFNMAGSDIDDALDVIDKGGVEQLWDDTHAGNPGK